MLLFTKVSKIESNVQKITDNRAVKCRNSFRQGFAGSRQAWATNSLTPGLPCSLYLLPPPPPRPPEKPPPPRAAEKLPPPCPPLNPPPPLNDGALLKPPRKDDEEKLLLCAKLPAEDAEPR